MAQSTSSNVCSVTCRNNIMVTYEGKMKKIYRSNAEYAAFRGIPYANIPRGLKRNQAPEPITIFQLRKLCRPSENLFPLIYEAKATGRRSAQLGRSDEGGSADCLYLNVFLPKRPELIDTRLPVLVFIHGGRFTHGSSDPRVITPDLIVQQNLIFVSMNYRLGLSGFMNARSEKCPGNAGLKDQVCALEWIRDNIEYFMGDPKNVTISGVSSGATCVNMHLISPASKDLFRRAIVQSGGVFCPWGYRGRQRIQSKNLLRRRKFGELFYAEEESEELQDYAHRRIAKDRNTRHPKSYSPAFGVTWEKDKMGAFVTDDIKEMMKMVDHNKPVMAGITKEEGLYQYVVSLDEYYEFANSNITNDDDFRKTLMDNFRWSRESADRRFDEIRNNYFPDWHNMSGPEKHSSYLRFVRDIWFRRFYDNFRFGPQGTVHGNLYVYRFDHFSELCSAKRFPFRNFDAANEFPYPTQQDDMRYLYCPKILKRSHEQFIYEGPHQNPTIQTVMNHMCSLWANFCKTGELKSDFDPHPVTWRPHTEQNPCFMSISENLTLIEGSLFEEEWDWLNSRVNLEPTIDSSADASPVEGNDEDSEENEENDE